MATIPSLWTLRRQDKLVINESEAVVVRRIFEMSANGQSLKTIAKALNHECVPSPRPRSGNQYATWSPSCIREMLRRDLYAGKVVWNSSRFVKVSGTNKRVRHARPESEWRIVPHPELQIVSDEVWKRVQDRQKSLMALYDRFIEKLVSAREHRADTAGGRYPHGQTALLPLEMRDG